MKTYEIGQSVKVNTPAGIVDGTITFYWRSNINNQFAVKFNYIDSGCGSIEMTFSKKTGLPYNNPLAKSKGFKVIF